jgi:ABC-type transport system involved in multi-copper enzyme maturation permease subunit
LTLIAIAGHIGQSILWLWERAIGPLFEKELRVVSRQKNLYALRSGYVLLLLAIFVLAWVSVAFSGGRGGTKLSSVAHASQACQSLTMALVWFQFLAMQLLAVGMMSSAISEEAKTQTLSVLFTTPLTGIQFILGKFISRLLQLGTLMVLALPMLALIRVYGGIDWGVIIQGTAVTLAAMVFAAALSLFVSVWFRKSYVVVIITLVAMGILYGLPPLGATFFLMESEAMPLLCPVNPFLLLICYTDRIMNPGGISATLTLSCLNTLCVMLGMSALLVMGTVYRLRSRVLQLAWGPDVTQRSQRCLARGQRQRDAARQRAVIPVTGCPLIWRGLLNDRFKGKRLRAIVYSLLVLGLIGYIVSLAELMNNPGNARTFYMPFFYLFSVGLNFIASLRTAAMAATSIASEKEAKTLPILLTTPFADQTILKSKAIVAFRRNRPLWILTLCLGCAALITQLLSQQGLRYAVRNDEMRILAYYGMWLLAIPIWIAFVVCVFKGLNRAAVFNMRPKTICLVLVAYILMSFLESVLFKGALGASRFFATILHLIINIYLSISIGLYCGCRVQNSTRAVVTTFIGMLLILLVDLFLFRLLFSFILRLLPGFISKRIFFLVINTAVSIAPRYVVARLLQKHTEKWFRRNLFATT